MPVVDSLAPDYADQVTFIGVAWKSSLERTASAAESLLPSGAVRWGLDENEDVFAAYLIPYQPWTVLISGSGVEVERWPGARPADEIRASIEQLIES